MPKEEDPTKNRADITVMPDGTERERRLIGTKFQKNIVPIKKDPQRASFLFTEDTLFQEAIKIHQMVGKGNVKKLETLYTKILEINPRNTLAMLNLGDLYVAENKPHEAIKCYENALKINPNFPKAHYNIGTLYDDIHNTTMAIKHFLKAIELKTDYVEAHYNLASVAYNNRDYPLALEHFKRYRELTDTGEDNRWRRIALNTIKIIEKEHNPGETPPDQAS